MPGSQADNVRGQLPGSALTYPGTDEHPGDPAPPRPSGNAEP